MVTILFPILIGFRKRYSFRARNGGGPLRLHFPDRDLLYLPVSSGKGVVSQRQNRADCRRDERRLPADLRDVA